MHLALRNQTVHRALTGYNWFLLPNQRKWLQSASETLWIKLDDLKVSDVVAV